MIPEGMQYFLNRKYAALQEQANAPQQTVGTPVNAFGTMKAGETRGFRSFTANQVGDPAKGGMQIIGGRGSPLGMMDLLRTQGYTPEQATSAVTGGAQATALGAESRLNDVRSLRLPLESIASIAKTGAETNLIGQQARVVVPESQARIGQLNAETSYTGTQNQVLRRSDLTDRFVSPESEDTIKKLRGYQGFRLGEILGR